MVNKMFLEMRVEAIQFSHEQVLSSKVTLLGIGGRRVNVRLVRNVIIFLL